MEERAMNKKRYVISSIVVFVVLEILNYIIHVLILKGPYEATSDLWRAADEMKSNMWIGGIGDLVWSFLFVYIFSKGYEAKGWLEGLRYGVIIGLFLYIPMALGSYTVMPIPFSLSVYWFICGLIQITIVGIVAALIYRPAKAARKAAAKKPAAKKKAARKPARKPARKR
jgi:hypothetical protein